MAKYTPKEKGGPNKPCFPDERKLGFEDLFWEVDKDRSGTLDRKELLVLLQKTGYGSAVPDLEAKFNQMDKNKDGMISYDEYLEAMGALPALTHRHAFYRRKFKRYDLDGDGVITLEEMRRVFDSMGNSSNTDFAIEAFRRCDRDNSGKVEYDEFIKHFCSGD